MDGEEGDQSPSLPTGVSVNLYNCCYEIDISLSIASIDVLSYNFTNVIMHRMFTDFKNVLYIYLIIHI